MGGARGRTEFSVVENPGVEAGGMGARHGLSKPTGGLKAITRWGIHGLGNLQRLRLFGS